MDLIPLDLSTKAITLDTNETKILQMNTNIESFSVQKCLTPEACVDFETALSELSSLF